MGIVSDDEDAPMLHNADDGEDPLALLRSLPMGDDGSDSDREPPKKRAKKWFEDDSEDEGKKSKAKGKVFRVQEEPETLEDLEALATGLLD